MFDLSKFLNLKYPIYRSSINLPVRIKSSKVREFKVEKNLLSLSKTLGWTQRGHKYERNKQSITKRQELSQCILETVKILNDRSDLELARTLLRIKIFSQILDFWKDEELINERKGHHQQSLLWRKTYQIPFKNSAQQKCRWFWSMIAFEVLVQQMFSHSQPQGNFQTMCEEDPRSSHLTMKIRCEVLLQMRTWIRI